MARPRHWSVQFQRGVSVESGVSRQRGTVVLGNLKLTNKRVYLRAMDVYASAPFLDFEDAVIVAQMERHAMRELLSYDTDFDHILSVDREEPALPSAA